MTQYPTAPSNKPSLPTAFQGQIFEQVGKYARQAVLYAFQEVGGAEGLSEWAQENKSEFYTKLFPKIIAKESEVKVTRDIDSLMDVIDGEYEIESAGASEVEEAVMLPDTGEPPLYADEVDLDMVEFEE